MTRSVAVSRLGVAELVDDAQDCSAEGIVVVQGTDTIEETANLLAVDEDAGVLGALACGYDRAGIRAAYAEAGGLE